jgi:hypothetical protein
MDDLDDDMMTELDLAYRSNQLVNLPFVKSGKAEAILHEEHPELAAMVVEERDAKIRNLAFHIRLLEEESKHGGSKGKYGSLESASPSPISQRKHRKSTKDAKAIIKQQGSPADSKEASDDHIFDMELNEISSPIMVKATEAPPSPLFLAEDSTVVDDPEDDTRIWYDSKGKALQADNRGQSLLSLSKDRNESLPIARRSGSDNIQGSSKPSLTKQNWLPIGPVESKSDMADMMSQTANNRTSNLAKGLSLQAGDKKFEGSFNAKLTQRERKKQQQQQLEQSLSRPDPAPRKELETSIPSKPSSPWRTASRGPLVSLKDVLDSSNQSSPSPSSYRPHQPPPPPQPSAPAHERSKPTPHKEISIPARAPSSTSRSPPPTTDHLPNASPTLNLSLTDIIYQQEAEQAILRKAVEKRSLQEIQQEQEFQEWWDSESRKVREEGERDEAREARASSRGRGRGKRSGRGRGRGKIGAGRGGTGGGGGSASTASAGGSSTQRGQAVRE